MLRDHLSVTRRSSLFRLLGVLTLSLIGSEPAWAAPNPSSVELLVQDAGSESRPFNEWCPVLTDELIDPDIKTEYDGETVYLCCQKCLKQFRADPEAFAMNLPTLASGRTTSLPREEEHSEDSHEDSSRIESGDESHMETGSSGAAQHDHSDHGESAESGPGAILQWVGRLHPMVVHFPIALLVVAAMAELLAMITSRLTPAFAARFCLWGGAIGALVGASLGWVNAISAEPNYAGFSADLLSFHRWFGVATAASAVIALVLSERCWRSGPGSQKLSYRAMLLLTVVLVSITGHLGASLIYGWEYLAW